MIAGEVITDEEWMMKRPDGRQVTILCNAGPIRDGSGVVTAGMIAGRDITDRKEAERALHEQAPAQRDSDRTKTAFRTIVSHELRQPLTAAHAAVSVMEMRCPRLQEGVCAATSSAT